MRTKEGKVRITNGTDFRMVTKKVASDSATLSAYGGWYVDTVSRPEAKFSQSTQEAALDPAVDPETEEVKTAQFSTEAESDPFENKEIEKPKSKAGRKPNQK